MNLKNMTVVIAARNAAETISRAVDSAYRCGVARVLLIDDYSEDETVSLAQSSEGVDLKVVRPERKLGLGNARNEGIRHVDTPYLMWLDADDELLPSRAERMLESLETGADMVFDGAELFDGDSLTKVRDLRIPDFLLKEGAMVRSFERNYLPGPAWPALRTDLALRFGYDASLATGDDLDFILRAIKAGASIETLDLIGYRQYAYGSSLSRKLDLQRSCAKKALAKHAYEDVRRHYLDAGFSPRIAAWGLCYMATFREEYESALGFLDEACPPGSDSAEVLELDGPFPYPEGWRRGFQEGTLRLLLGRDRAVRLLQTAEARIPTPEGANNLGVALQREGCEKEAKVCFEDSLFRFPGYRDATLNLEGNCSTGSITTHPLRSHSSRSEYS